MQCLSFDDSCYSAVKVILTRAKCFLSQRSAINGSEEPLNGVQVLFAGVYCSSLSFRMVRVGIMCSAIVFGLFAEVGSSFAVV